MSETSRTLSAKFCRIGLNRLWVLKMDNGIQDAVTHIGLGRGLYTPTGEEAQLRDEFLRVPVLDSYKVSDSQYAYYATALLESLPAGKLNEPVGEIAFFLSDGTILAIYSSSIPETYLTIGVLARLIYSLKIDAVPAGSLTLTNTQVYFQPGIRESILKLFTDALDKKIADVDRDGRIAGNTLAIQNAEKTLSGEIEWVRQSGKSDLDEQAKQFLFLLAWEQHTQAMYRRARGHSGIMAVRQYTYHGNLKGTASSEKGTPGHMHQHPEWGDLVGTGEIWGCVNGWLFKARHRDHHMQKAKTAGSAWLATENLMPTTLPVEITSQTTIDGQMTAMKALFARFNAGEWPAGFRADMSAIELWFEPYSSTIEDTYHSQRHALQTNSMADALRLMMHYAHSGLKDRFENQSVEMPLVAWLDEAGNPQLGILRYRMICTSLESMGDVRQYLEPVDDFAFDEGGWGRPSLRYRVKENIDAPGALDQMMALLPGLDGDGAVLTENHTRYGTTESIRTWANANTPLNAAYYNRFAQALGDDAANRHRFIRGDYDPYLFVASNTRPEVLPMKLGATTYRWSMAIPMEVIIRTPLESWNPYNVPAYTGTVRKGYSDGYGKTADNPIPGLNAGMGMYFMTPAEMFAGASNAEAADTATGEYWVTCGDGVNRKMRASGIWINTPPIVGTTAAKTRFAIHPEHQEGDKPYTFAMGAYRKNAGVSMRLMTKYLEDKLEAA